MSISTLNDFIFCPYSIYLHNVYMDTDEEMYHATPQIRGKASHSTVDSKTYSSHKGDITALPICCNELGVYGKIDLYKEDTRTLIERKYQLKHIYRGQFYQLWAEYYCMLEMGYQVEHLAFYEISTNKSTPIPLPETAEKEELETIIQEYRQYDPSHKIEVNTAKCTHCIYCNLCDKTDMENVYE